MYILGSWIHPRVQKIKDIVYVHKLVFLKIRPNSLNLKIWHFCDSVQKYLLGVLQSDIFWKDIHIGRTPKKICMENRQTFLPPPPIWNLPKFWKFSKKYAFLQHPYICSESKNQKSASGDLFPMTLAFIWYIHVGVLDTPQSRKNQRFKILFQNGVILHFSITLLIS